MWELILFTFGYKINQGMIVYVLNTGGGCVAS